MSATPLADLLATAAPDWKIGRNEQLHLWTAEKISNGGRSVHYLVAMSARELETKIRAAGEREAAGQE